MYMMVIAAAVYICQRLHIALPSLINNYLNDFLCMPIVLIITQLLARKIKKDKQYIIKNHLIILIVLYYSVYFEYYLPKVNARYTADFIDVILYALGGFVFYFLENSSLGKKGNKQKPLN